MNPAEITQTELAAASKAEDAHGSHDQTTGKCACGADIGYGFFGWYHHWLAAIITAAREAATTPQAHATGAGAADKPHEHQWLETTTYGDRGDGFTEVMKCTICGTEEKR